MAVGDLITAARFNEMQAKVALVLGNGSGRFGYGQNLSSSAVSIGNTVNATHMQNLKLDCINAYVHQTGINPVLTDVARDEDITEAVFAQYENIVNTIYSNKDNIDISSQADIEAKKSSTRTGQWGGANQSQSLFFRLTVTFDSFDARRHFFNAGGEIRINAGISSGSGAKFTDWKGMLDAMGTVRISAGTTTADSGSGLGIGNFGLTTNNQALWIKSGSGIYAANDVTVRAKLNAIDGNQIILEIEFNDGATGSGAGGFGGVDDPVNGVLVATVTQVRATYAIPRNNLYVQTPSPVYNVTKELE